MDPFANNPAMSASMDNPNATPAPLHAVQTPPSKQQPVQQPQPAAVAPPVAPQQTATPQVQQPQVNPFEEADKQYQQQTQTQNPFEAADKHWEQYQNQQPQQIPTTFTSPKEAFLNKTVDEISFDDLADARKNGYVDSTVARRLLPNVLRNWANKSDEPNFSDLPQSGANLSTSEKLSAAGSAIGRQAVSSGDNIILKPIVKGIADLMQAQDEPGKNITPEATSVLALLGPKSIASGTGKMIAANEANRPHPAAGGAGSLLEGAINNEYEGPIADLAAKTAKQQGLMATMQKQQDINRAHEVLSQVLNDSGEHPSSIVEQLQIAKNNPLPETALDVAQNIPGGIKGRQLQQLGRMISNSPGEGSTLAGTLANRGEQTKQWVNAALDTALGKDTPYAATAAAQENLASVVQPLRDKAMAVQPVYTDAIKKALNDPDVRSGIPHGIREQRLEALAERRPPTIYDKAVVSFNEAGDPVIGNVPNMNLLDAAKRGLDIKIEAEMRSDGSFTKLGRALIRAKGRFLEDVDTINPAYKDYRLMAGDQLAVKKAAEMGRNFASLDPEEIQQFVKNPETSVAAKIAFGQNMRRSLVDKIDTMRTNADVSGNLWKDSLKKRIAPVIEDPEAFNNLDDIMNRIQNITTTNKTVTSGSPTFQNLAFNNEVGPDTGNMVKRGLHAIFSTKTAAINEFARLFSPQAQQTMKNLTPGAKAEIMKYLSSSDPNLWQTFLDNHYIPKKP